MTSHTIATGPQQRAANAPSADTVQHPAPPATRRAPPAWLPSWKQVWFQLHWFIGITAGTVLMIIGLSGATISFKDELLDLMNPGVRHVPVETRAALTPDQLSQVAAAAHGQRVASVTMYAEAGAAPRVFFAPKPGERRGESVYLHPYTGAIQPEMQGAHFFEWAESLHRWLLLPRAPGRQVAGALALCLLGLALSGLYLRWPRRPLDWRTWLTFDPALKGRSFLWNLHAVAGTWCLVVYVMLTLTGLYWSYDFIRDNVDAWAGRPPRVAQAPNQGGKGKKAPAPQVELATAWRSFNQHAPGWTLTTMRLPTRAGETVQFTWVAADAPHERARSSMAINPQDGSVTENKPHASQGLGSRLVSIIYPLHMGTYFGLAGRIIVTLASLALPLFGITGWMLYLGRRKAKRAVKAQRAMLGGGEVLAATGMPTLVAYASQSGQAERLALESARALQQAGVPVAVRALDQIDPGELRQYEQALIVASTFGEGEAPDGTRRFARLLDEAAAPSLAGLQFGLLALGDRHYTQFCGFGHALDARLRALGATHLFPLIEVDRHDPVALDAWSQALARTSGSAIDAIGRQEEASYDSWRLVSRTLLNPGSQGGALFEIALAGPAEVDWQAGALAEIIACNADGSEGEDGSTPHAPRSYSLASLPRDGQLQLLVRQERHAGASNGGYGVASGWLTQFAPLGSALRLRLQANPAFAPCLDDLPCIYIGNGSGLAGLRSHLRARQHAGLAHNWLLFGERQQAVDSLCAQELEGWLHSGHLARLDRTYSRDGDAHEYVQHRLRQQAGLLRDWLAQGALIYVCGSLQGMAGGVDAVLLEVLGQDGLDALTAQGRYRRDVY
ncbi:PepSY domain-containing protein [Janthinobacterium aquaticum]|uniref:PepSY domain-containing protein n=1 Tax=Janthinobacterium sp. FT58W TaxID=2654254 RepID=UPI001264AB59|nr:sulfite reductase flavoprotein subunit alpha [Janthinobacterium sp. FT58W]KAB8044345.1 nitric oxide synthase [Janthinobacterium sp. FT58W]